MKHRILAVLVRYVVTAALDVIAILTVVAILSAGLSALAAYAIAMQRPDMIEWLRAHTGALVLCAIIVALVNVALWYAAWSRRVARAAADRLTGVWRHE